VSAVFFKVIPAHRCSSVPKKTEISILAPIAAASCAFFAQIERKAGQKGGNSKFSAPYLFNLVIRICSY